MDTEVSYAVRQRLYLIDFLLTQYGTINRSALMRYFGISQPQASADFSLYIKLYPGNMGYDKSRRTHVRLETFSSAYFPKGGK